MNKTTIATAVIAAVIAAPASSALYCKNDKGQNLFWQVNDPKPNTSIYTFDIRAERDIVCFANSYIYYNLIANRVIGLPVVTGIVTSGLDGDGVIWRGDMARWVIENVPSANGQNTTKAQYDAAKP